MEYKSKDFHLCAIILATGVELLRIEKLNEKVSIFVFGISETEANRIIQDHWARQLILPTRNIIEAIYELKTRLYSER